MDEAEKKKQIELLRCKLRRINAPGKTQMILDELYKLTKNEN